MAAARAWWKMPFAIVLTAVMLFPVYWMANVSLTNRAYCVFVTSVRASQKPRRMRTVCTGISSGWQSPSPPEQPIAKLPGGIHT